MIITRYSAANDIVDTDIHTIKAKVAGIIHENLATADIGDSEPCDCDQTLKHYLGCKKITINNKNIEYQEEFDVSGYPMCDEAIKTLNKLDAADVRVVLTVYRLGQYSYYMAEPYLVRSDLGACC